MCSCVSSLSPARYHTSSHHTCRAKHKHKERELLMNLDLTSVLMLFSAALNTSLCMAVCKSQVVRALLSKLSCAHPVPKYHKREYSWLWSDVLFELGLKRPPPHGFKLHVQTALFPPYFSVMPPIFPTPRLRCSHCAVLDVWIVPCGLHYTTLPGILWTCQISSMLPSWWGPRKIRSWRSCYPEEQE